MTNRREKGGTERDQSRFYFYMTGNPCQNIILLIFVLLRFFFLVVTAKKIFLIAI